MLSSRGNRSKTLFRKAHQFAHICDAQVYLVIQYNGMEVKHIYHSHPDGEWPSLNWSQTVCVFHHSLCGHRLTWSPAHAWLPARDFHASRHGARRREAGRRLFGIGRLG